MAVLSTAPLTPEQVLALARQRAQALAAGDYTAVINPRTITKDPRFLADLRLFYRERDGQEFATDEELLDYFFEDRNWRNLNTVSIARDVADAYGMSEDQRARMRRIQSVFDALPSFWREGGRGVAALPDIAGAVLADPLNLIPGTAGAKVGIQAARAGAPVASAALRGGARAALLEGAASGAIEAGADIGLQARDIQIGLQDEFSPGQTAASAASGALLTAPISGAIGAGSAIAGFRREAARLGQQAAEEAAAQERAANAPIQAAQARGLLMPLPEATDPQAAAREAQLRAMERPAGPSPNIQQRLRDVEDIIRQALADGNPQPEELATLQREHALLLRMANFERTKPARVAEIEQLTEQGKYEEASKKRIALMQDEALFARLSADPQQLDFLDELAAPQEPTATAAAPAPDAPPTSGAPEQQPATVQSEQSAQSAAQAAQSPEQTLDDDAIVEQLISLLEMLGPQGARREVFEAAVDADPALAPARERLLQTYDSLMEQYADSASAALTPQQQQFVENEVALYRLKLAKEEPDLTPVQVEARVATLRLMITRRLLQGAAPEQAVPSPAERGPTPSRLGKPDFNIVKPDRLPSWMRKGDFIGRAPSVGQFSMEAARARAREMAGARGNVRDVAPFRFVWDGKATRTADGQRIKSGDEVFYDPRTDKLWAKDTNIPGQEKKPAARPEQPAPEEATPADPGAAAVRAAAEELARTGDMAAFRARLAEILGEGKVASPETSKARPDTSKVRPDAGAGGTQQGTSGEPQTSGENRIGSDSEPNLFIPEGRVLAVQRRSNPNDIRVASPNQVASGAGPEALIGRGNPDDWVVGHVPAGSRSGKVAPDAFTPADATAARVPERAPEPTAEGKLPPDWTELANIKVPWGGGEITAQELLRNVRAMENAPWPRTTLGVLDTIQYLRDAYRVLPDFRQPVASREEAVQQITKIFEDRDPATIVAARDFIRRLGGDPNVAPIIDTDVVPNAFGSFTHLPTNPDRFNRVHIGVLPENDPTRYKPEISTFYHEVAHWAYHNILTPTDRLAFWESILEQYKAGGPKDLRGLPRSVSRRVARNLPHVEGNALESPQEYFANQFEQWMASGGRTPGNQTLWRRVAEIIENLIRRFFDKGLIDPALEPLFAKILPDDVARARVETPTVEPKTQAGRDIRAAMGTADQERIDLERRLNTLDPQPMAAAIFNASRGLARLMSSETLPIDVRERFQERVGAIHEKMNEAAGRSLSSDEQVLALANIGNDIVDLHHDLQRELAAAFKAAEGGEPRLPGNPHEAKREPQTPLGRVALRNLALIEDARAAMQQALLTESASIPDVMRDTAKQLQSVATLGSMRRLRGQFNELARQIYALTGSDGTDPDFPGVTTSLSDDTVSQLFNLAAEVDDAFNRASDTLKRVFKRVEKYDPDTGRAWRRSALGAKYAARAKIRKQIAKRAERQQAQTNAAVNKVVTTPKARRQTAPTPAEEQAGAPSLLKMSDEDLTAELNRVGIGTARGQQIAFEIARRAAAKPVEVDPNTRVPLDIFRMRGAELRAALDEALQAGDRERVTQIRAEIQRRADKRAMRPRNSAVQRAIAREVEANAGVPTDDGIPFYADEHAKEILRRITHRDPQAQYAARVMTYRMLNLLGRTAREGLAQTNIMSVGDLYRLAGSPLPEGVDPEGAFFDFSDPAFAKLRADLRRMAIGLKEGQATPMTVMHEIGHMVLRTNLFSPEERASIVEAFQKADDEVAQAIRNNPAYGEEPLETRAEEWFVERWANYAAERVAKGDVWRARLEGPDAEANLRLKSRLEVILDRLVEAVAYVVNGLIGRNDIKQMFRRMTFYGDMLGGSRVEGATQVALPPELARAYSEKAMRAAGMSRKQRMEAFVANGVGRGPNGEVRIFFHGTPSGAAFNRRRNPDVVLEPSSNGLWGPGVYATDNEAVATEVYAADATPTAVRRMAEEKGLDPEAVRFVEESAEMRANLVSARKAAQREMERTRRNGSAMLGVDTDDRLAQLQNEISQYDALIADIDRDLADLGIQPQPLVLPLVVRMLRPFDLRIDTRYRRTDPAIAEIEDVLSTSDVVNPIIVQQVFNDIPESGVNGVELYQAILLRAFTDDGRTESEAKTEIAALLQDLGYDGLRTTHENALRSGAVVEHEGLVVFDPANVKHVNARWFDWNNEGLYRSEIQTPIAPSASIVEAALETDAPFNTRNPAPMLSAFQAAGVGPALTGLARKVLRREAPTPTDMETARKFSWPLQLRSNSRRLREISNAHYVADWIAPENGPGIAERHNQELAAKVVPVFEMLNKLPGAGAVNRWRHSLKFWGQVSQPESFTRIVKAMRRGDPSNLSADERRIYDRISTLFREELGRLRDAGVEIGNILNYFPQVWDVEAIRRNTDEFRAKLADYFQRESRLDPARSPIGREDALGRADRVLQRLLDDEGVYIPPKAETASPTSDHVDYNRMIKLHLPDFREDLDALEPFLVSDLQGLLAKYFDGSTRRIQFNQQWGVNNHAFHDYKAVAAYGLPAVRELLSTRKILNVDRRVVTDEGVEVVSLRKNLMVPLDFNVVGEAAQTALDMVQAGDKAGAKRYLMSLQPYQTPTYERRVDAIVNALADFGGRPRGMANQELKFMDGLFRTLQRKPIDTGPFFEGSLKASKFLRNFNSVTLLGFTTLTSVPDVALPLIRSGNMKAWLSGLRKWGTDPDYRAAIRNVGVGVENIVHQQLATLYGNAGGRFSNAFFNATMLAGWTQTQREIAGLVAFEAFKTEARRMLQNQPRIVNGVPVANRAHRMARRFLERYGLEHYGRPGAPNLDDINVLRNDPKVRAAIIKFANETIFAPNPNDIPLWAQTPWGSVAFQLKSFPLMMGRLAKDVLKEAGRGNVAPLLYMASIGAGLGAAQMAIKDVVQARGGEDERSFDLRERSLSQIAEAMGYDVRLHGDVDTFLGWYVESFMALGGLGMVAELLYNTASMLDNGSFGFQRTMGYLFGPTVGTAASAFNVAAGVTSLIRDEDSNAKLRTAVRETALRVPVAGGIRAFREGATDLIAGEAQRGGGGGGFGRGFEGGFDSGLGGGF